MNWVNVEDGLPDDSHGRVLVWVTEQCSLGKSGYIWNCGYSDKTGFTDNFVEYNVTHWMPLPEPPTLENTNAN